MRELQRYIPVMRRIADCIEKDKGGSGEKNACQKRLLAVYKLIDNPGNDKPVGLKVLLKIEKILVAIHRKYLNKGKKGQQSPKINDGAGPSTSYPIKELPSEKNYTQESHEKKSIKLSTETRNFFKTYQNPLDNLFTPDTTRSKSQPLLSNSNIKSSTGGQRPRFKDEESGRTRPSSHDPRGESQKARFQEPEHQERKSSSNDPRGEDRRRGTRMDSETRYRQLYEELAYPADRKSSYRNKSSEDRSRGPHPTSESADRCRVPPPRLVSSQVTNYSSIVQAIHRPHNTSDTTRTVTYHGSPPQSDSDNLEEKQRSPRFNDSKERFYEKPKTDDLVRREEDIIVSRHEMYTKHPYSSHSKHREVPSETKERERKLNRLESSGYHKSRSVEEEVSSKSSKKKRFEKAETVTSGSYSSSNYSSSSSKSMLDDVRIEIKPNRRERYDLDRDEPPRKKMKDKSQHSSTASTLSSNIKSSLNRSSSNMLCSLEEITLEQRDIEKLNQSTQQLKSNLNNRLKNMKAKRLLMANSKTEPAACSSESAVRSLDGAIDSKSDKCQDMFFKDKPLQSESTKEDTDSFIDNIMSNLTTKFGFRRGVSRTDRPGNVTTNSDVAAGLNINLDKCLANVPSIPCGINDSHKGTDVKEASFLETNINTIRKPLISKEDQAELVMTVQQILSEKAKSMEIGNQAAEPLIENSLCTVPIKDDKQHNSDIPSISTTPNDVYVNEIQIPGLDGIIPSILDKNSVLSSEIKSNESNDKVQTIKENEISSHRTTLEQNLTDKESKQGSNKKSETVISSHKDHDSNLNQNPKLSCTQSEDLNKPKNSSSLRSKLTDEISTFHKVGTPCGGALRGLVERDKMMPSGQIASLKPGALFDLMGEERPSRSSPKTKLKSLTPNISSEVHGHGETEKTNFPIKTKNPDDILSKLSESDLRKIITENIEALPIPPNLPFLTNTTCTNDNCKNVTSPIPNETWRNQINPIHSIHDNSKNISIVNDIALPDSKTAVQQSDSNWSTYENQSWKNKLSAKDPRCKSQLISNVASPNQQCLENVQNALKPLPEQVMSSFENKNYNSSNFNSSDPYIEHLKDPFPSNPPLVLQTDPLISPCYDGSATPDPYRPDPYTISLNMGLEKQSHVRNEAKEMLNVYPRPPMINESTYPYESHNFRRESSQRPSLLSQSYSLGNTSQDRDLYYNYIDSQQSHYYDPRNTRRVPSTYAEWKAERQLAESRNLNNFQTSESSQIHCRQSMSDQRNYNRHRWVNESFHNRGNNYSQSQNQTKEFEMRKKMSARDPRRRSVEEKPSSSNQALVIGSNNEDRYSKRHDKSSNENRCERPNERDTIVPERKYPTGRLIRKDEDRQYGSRDGSQSRSHNRTAKERSNPTMSKTNEEKSKDKYLSPLDKLYAETPTPKTGLGYGFQKFRIPKVKGSFTNNINKKTKETPSEKKSLGPPEETKRQVAPQIIDESVEDSNGLEINKSKPNLDIDIQVSISNLDNEKIESEPNAVLQKEKCTSADKPASPVSDLQNTSCRRSGRLLERKRGRPPKTKLAWKKENEKENESTDKPPDKIQEENVQNNINVVDKSFESVSINETTTDKLSDSASTNDPTDKPSDSVSTNATTDKSSESVSTNKTDTDKSESVSTNETTTDKLSETVSTNEITTNKSSESVSTNETATNIGIFNKLSEGPLVEKGRLNTEVDTSSLEVNKQDLTLDENLAVSLEKCNLVTKPIILPQMSPEKGSKSDANSVNIKSASVGTNQNPNEANSIMTCNAENYETNKSTEIKPDTTEKATLKKIEEDKTLKSVEIPGTVDIVSQVENEHVNKSDAVSKTPDISLIKQVELLEGVIGIKLTPDKIRKVAELLSVTEIKDIPKSEEHNRQGGKTDKPNETFPNESENVDNRIDKPHNLDQSDLINDEKQESSNLKPKRKYRNELDRLQEDISKYHDSEAIAAASGPRQCRLQKEKHTNQTQIKINQNAKSKSKKYREDTDDFKEMSLKDQLLENKEVDECDTSERKEDEESPDEEHVGGSDSDSSDDIHLYSEKMKTKYSFILEEAKEDISSEKIKPETSVDETIKITKLQNDLKIDRQDIKDIESTGSVQETFDEFPPIPPISVTTTIDNEIGNMNHEATDENLVSLTQSEPAIENNHDKKSNNFDEETPSKIFTSPNLPNKAITKKQKKKTSWSAGIIKKKSRSRKSRSSGENTTESDVENLETELGNHTDDDGNETENHEPTEDVNELYDINYFQEGESKAMSCKLCSYNGKSIVTHYAITHPKDEVLISRMSPEAARDAIKESEQFFSLCEEKQKDVSSLFACRICCFKSNKFSSFFEHMALHTGEFRHECCKCGYRTSTRSGILKHSYSHNLKSSNDKSCRVLYKEPKDKTYFVGYLCLLCNYFQISEKNLKRHLENVHEVQDSNQIIKINFSKVSLTNLDIDLGKKIESSVTTLSDENEKIGDMPINEGVAEAKKQEINFHSSDASSVVKDTDTSIQPEELENSLQDNVYCDKTLEDKNTPEIWTTANTPRNNSSKGVQNTENLEEQKAVMIIKEDWFSKMCDNISEMNHKYLTENCKDFVRYRVEDLKHKSNSTYIFHDIIQRGIPSAQSVLSLNSLLDTCISFTYPRKSTRSDEETDQSLSQEVEENHKLEEAPARRQLPERTCKGGLIKQTNDKDSELNIDENDDPDFLELFNSMELEDNWEDDLVNENIVSQTLTGEPENTIISTVTHNNLMCLYEPLQNYLNKNAMRKPLSIQDKPYTSSLPLNSNFSEFTYVMKQISQFSLKLLEGDEVKVGGLKAVTSGGTNIFSCSLKTFNKECGFQTPDLGSFGQHINMLHHTSYWNGICCTCKVHFVQDPNSHDKVSINTQSKAFCHLVRQHVIFTKKPSKQTSRVSLAKNEVPLTHAVPPTPRLRVRRLSGDQLSGMDAENILPMPVIEVSGQEDQEITNSLQFPHQPPEACLSSSAAISQTDAETSLPIRVEAIIGVKTFKLPIDIEGSVSTIKTETKYNEMRALEKLRDLYKCMGMNCSFTSSSMRDFSIHIENHRETQTVDQGENILADFWNVCAYCLTSFLNAKDLCIHIRKKHAICIMQCSLCFYRAKSIANVHYHHSVDHAGENFMVLHCEQTETNLPQFIEKPFTDYVSAFRCNATETCALFTYMINRFCAHIQTLHPENMVCHLCSDTFLQVNELLEHYCHKHGMGMFQCLFCTFGARKEEEIRLHLCYAHSDVDPKALQRIENSPKPNMGKVSKESIKRIMFFKDQEKLFQFVHYRTTSPTQRLSSLETPLQELNKEPRQLPIILRKKGPPATKDATNIVAPANNPLVASLPDPIPVEAVTVVNSPQLSIPAESDESAPSQDNMTEPNQSSNIAYFRCGNKGCDYETTNSRPLREHLMFCELSRSSPKLICTYCRKEFKHTAKYIDHLLIHGPNLYSCALCKYESRLAKVNYHMKTIHHFLTTTVLPVDREKTDPEQDLFVVHGKEKRRPGKKPGPKSKPKVESKTKFSPQDLDKVPKAAIFLNALGCTQCSYETKVRSNLIRHIQLHLSGELVTQEEFVNPVPEKTEKMFDKMMNLAGSSHKKKPGLESSQDETAVECLYKYVPDQDRYKCHVKECGYRTLSETMLRDHISVIHKDETHYVCPHCVDKVEAAAFPIDHLSMHLKLHDSPVYKCSNCEFCSHIRRSIERHTEVAHSGEQVEVQVVRLFKPDHIVNKAGPKLHNIDTSDEQGVDSFSCNLCTFKTKKKKVILQHGISEHKMAKPFKCSLCGYECVNEPIDHCKTYHPDEESHIISLYKKVTEMKRPALPPIPPLWKRDAKRLKLIRGIILDERGDAPPPVVTATTGIDGLDLLELKFGHFGTPLGTSFMCPRCSTSYSCKNRQEMKEHLFKDLDYSPIRCKICKTGSTMRSRLMKHINKVHNIEWERISEYIDIYANEELENWVDRVLSRQQSLMSAEPNKTEESRKRRRSTETVSSSSQSTTPPPQGISTTTVVETSPSSQETTNYTSDEERGREKRRRDKCPSRHRYSCEYCDVTAKYKHSIVTHAKKSHPDKPPMVKTFLKTFEEKMDAYNCMYCNCTALDLNTLKHHWTNAHKNSGLNFLFRNTVFNTELDYECYWCKKRSDLESLEEHCREEHSVDQRFLVTSVSVPKYKCSLCKFENLFKSVDILKRHFALIHPSKKISYVVVEPEKPVIFSHQNSPSSSSESEKLPQLISTTTSTMSYQCFNCSYGSPKLWLIVKHMEGHFDTFVCNECTSWFPSAVEFRSHMLNKHPSSISRPKILKGSDTDIENAKKNIMVILESGVRRKITEEELAEAEKESESDEENTEIYLSDETLEENLSPPQIKETARKSTGYRLTPPKHTSPLLERVQHKSPHRFQKELFPPDEESEDLEDTFVAVKMHGKIIRLPTTTFRKLINCDPDLMLPDVF
ncbi:uncharacterized protein LOC128998771 isoform X2 [Macrosteles quadrilineatus]|nr:uncharacterized protein LOC128998771 isoform X2 [Macrosteles quadrilineatus]